MRQTIKTLAAACAVYGIMAACSSPVASPDAPQATGGEGGATGAGGLASGGTGGAAAGSAGASPVPDASAAGAGGVGCDCPGLSWGLAATVQCVEDSGGGTWHAEWTHGMADDLEVAGRVRVIYDSAHPVRWPNASTFEIAGARVRVPCDGADGQARFVTLR